jgi:hypothetical protein
VVTRSQENPNTYSEDLDVWCITLPLHGVGSAPFLVLEPPASSSCACSAACSIQHSHENV